MSHVASIDVHIKDLEALQAACKELGLEFRAGQKNYRWFGRWVNDYNREDAGYLNGHKVEDYGKCLHAISVRGNAHAYDVGVTLRPDGKPGFSLIYDNWRGGKGLEDVIGKGACRLKQEYAAQVAMKQARKNGFRVQRVNQNGRVQLVCCK